MDNNSLKCCCGGSACCPSQQDKKIIIELLYLDLSVCQRCQGTERNLDNAINEVSNVLKAAGYIIEVNKINICSEELAKKHKFLSSPTIRINGVDIDLDIKESNCKDCGDLCGDSVDCRAWVYEGEEYTEPPKEMIINAILRAVYGGSQKSTPLESDYVLPDNLKNFFEGIRNKKKD